MQEFLRRLLTLALTLNLDSSAAAGILEDAITDSGLNEPDWPSNYKLKEGATFDYIVVGAGAAGSAVAARLALAGHSTLLVEPGEDPSLLTRIPGASQGLLGSGEDWAYKTQPNNVSCFASMDEQCRFSRGKCLGGSSSINYMMYVRGNRRDFDDWDVDGWTWDDVEPYFLKYEGLQEAAYDSLPVESHKYHNTTGIMEIEYFPESGNSWHPRIFEGLEELKFPLNPDVNGVSQIGVSRVVGSVLGGERMSAARAYLAREDVQEHLKVSKKTKCTGVIIDEDNVARGVKVVVKGLLLSKKLNLYARQEVILSAGTIGTPQILMLSGIGPADHLKEMNIDVKVDLPVGDNMTDHVLPLLLMQADRGFGLDAPNLFVFGAKGVQAAQWLATKDGALASNGLTDVTAFINTHCYDYENRTALNNSSECALPTVQLINAYIDRGLLPGVEAIVQNAIGFTADIVDQMSDINVNHALMVLSPVVLRPAARGYVRLATTDGTDDPFIYPNYLGDEKDVEEMLRSITILEHLAETKAYKENGASIVHLKLDGCPSYEAGREAYWRCYVRHLTYSVYHAVGTARLGAGGVLDAQLRVRGVQRLRVADLSAAPVLPRGNTVAVAVMLAERLADFILDPSTQANCTTASE